MKSNKRLFYKTVVTVEVLHEGPLDFNNDLEDLGLRMAIDECSGKVTVNQSEPLTPKEMVDALIKQRSSPESFGLDDEGNEIV